MATDETPDKLNVMLMGHSFVRRLRNWAFDHQKLNLNLDRNRVSVFGHGVGGGFVVRPSNVRSERSHSSTHCMPPKLLWNDISLISELNIRLLILEVGTNDLSRPVASPEKICREIFHFVEECIKSGASYIIICEVLYRRDLPQFNSKVDDLNEKLERASFAHNNVYFWHHSRNNFSVRFVQDYVASDGIHVDAVRGMARYYSSIRGAVLCGENALR